jgi:putative restriction endonuclease
MDLSLRNRLEKLALDQGFSILLGESDGWLAFQAHAVPTRLVLSLDAEGRYLVGTSHRGVGAELLDELLAAPYAHDGFDCFIAPSSTELFRIIGRIWSLSRSLPNGPLAEFERLLKEEPSTTEVERLRKERIGQNVFRSALMDYWEKSCAVTGVKNPTLLRASHIVPWARCESDKERLNVHNGLLLVATLDVAFDAGLISFNESGNILISEKLSKEDQKASSISPDMCLTRMNDEVRKRLVWHQSNLFQKV